MSLKSHVLVTRPEPGLSESLSELKKRGWKGVACPALKIIQSDPFPPLKCRAILVTSGQALAALSRQGKETLILTVGDKTAMRARQAGFKNVLAAGGDSESLKRLCIERQLTGPDIVLACGRGRSGQDYGQSFREQLSVKSLYAYKVERSTSLAQEAMALLKSDAVDSILFYSAETMAAFLSLCPSEVKKDHLKNVRAFCYAEIIAKKALNSALWRSVQVASYPPLHP